MIFMKDKEENKAEAKSAAKKEIAAKAERKPAAKKAEPKKHAFKKEESMPAMPAFKLFGRWDSNVAVNDVGLAAYINLRPRLLPRSAGAYRRPFHKSKMHIVERLALHMMVPGHQGKRHRITSGIFAGGFSQILCSIEKAMEIIEKKENTRLTSKPTGAEGAEQTGRPANANPIEVLVRAIENAAVREEVISYQLGSIMARDAVITSPQRRIDKTLRAIAQGTYRKTFNKKKGLENALADELIAASKGSNESHAIKERERIEREAEGSR